MKCKVCAWEEEKLKKFDQVILASGATINEKAFIMEGLTMYVCPECKAVTMDIPDIEEKRHAHIDTNTTAVDPP